MRKYILAFLLFGALLAPSCSGWLEENPKTQVPLDKMFESEQGFMDALTSCYIKMNNTTLYGRQLTMVELEYLAQHWDINTSTGTSNITSFKNFDYTTEYAESFIDGVFGQMYNLISQANIVLENLKTKGHNIHSDQLRGIIEAEALAIRAFAHTDILRLFGQLPKEATIQVSLPYAETVGIESIPYYSFTEFVKKINADLDAAEKLLEEFDPLLIPVTPGSTSTYGFSTVYPDEEFLSYRRFRFNYYAVLALRARLNMYIGNTDEAARYASTVVEKSKLELAGDSDYASENYALPSECILALSNSELATISTVLMGTSTYNYLTTTHLNELFAGNGNSNRIISGWNTVYQNQQQSITPVINKYRQPASGSTASLIQLSTQKQVIPLIRLSEMYLILMETAPNVDAFNGYYDTYLRARNLSLAQVPTVTPETMQTTVVDEYRRELFGEGQMFYTYKRLGMTTMKWRRNAVTEENYVVPLPRNEVGEETE